jgi:hypothetical protein
LVGGQNYQSVISKAPFAYSGYFLAISISWGLFFRINIILINVSLFGASISCALFEKFSTALHWFTEIRSDTASSMLEYRTEQNS